METQQPVLHESIQRREYTISTYFRDQTVCWFREQQIINNTSVSLYLIRRDGEVVEVPPRYPKGTYTKTILFMYTDCAGITECNRIDRSMLPARTVVELSIHLNDLDKDAIYIPDMDIAIATATHRSRLPDIHPAFAERQARQQAALFQACLEKNDNTFYFKVNSTDPAHKEFYVIINGIMTAWPITHHETENSVVAYAMGYHDGQDTKNMAQITFVAEDCLVDATISSEKESSYLWYLGVSRTKVQDLYTSALRESREKYTKKEVKERIGQALSEQQEEIGGLKSDIQTLTSKLRAVEGENMTFRQLESKRLERENLLQQQMQTKETFQMQQEKYKMEMENLERKYQFDRAAMYQKEEAERRRAEQTYRVNELKVEKEHHSVKASEVSMWGTVLKTAAVVAPVVYSLCLFLPAVTSGGIGLLFSGLRGFFSWFA